MFSFLFCFLLATTVGALEPPKTKDAFVSLMATADFFQPVCVLGRSLERHHHLETTVDQEGHLVIADGVDRVVLVDRRMIEEDAWLADHLINCGWTKVIAYEHLANPHSDSTYFPSLSYMNEHERNRLAQSFNKLHAFNVPYDRVVYLDADTLVRKDISNLFDCVGSPSEILSSLKPAGHFRLCAYQDTLSNVFDDEPPSHERWDIDSGVMVLTPSQRMFDNLVSTLEAEDREDSEFLGRYLFWTCATGNPSLALETQRQIATLLLYEDRERTVVALPRLWITGGWEGEENVDSPKTSGDRLFTRLNRQVKDYERWPMYQCKRLEERYNMRVSRAAHDYVTSPYQDIRIVHFSSSLWKPFFWQTSLFAGFFAEYRFYAGIEGPEHLISIVFLISLLLATYHHPGIEAIKRIMQPLTVKDYLISVLLGSIPGVVAPIFLFTPIIPRTTDPRLAILCLGLLVTAISILLAASTIKVYFELGESKMTTVVTYVGYCYLVCSLVYPISIMALAATRFNPSSLLIASGLLSYLFVLLFQICFLHPFLRPYFPSSRAVSPD